MLIRTGPLYTDAFATAEQDAGNTTGCMKLTNVDRELCVQLVLHVIRQLYITCILLVPAQCLCHQDSFILLSRHVVSFLPTAGAEE